MLESCEQLAVACNDCCFHALFVLLYSWASGGKELHLLSLGPMHSSELVNFKRFFHL